MITYSCTQTIEEPDHPERVTQEEAMARNTIAVTARITPRPLVTTARIVPPLVYVLRLFSTSVNVPRVQ